MSPSSALKRAADASPTEIPMLIGGEWRAAVRDLRGARSLSRHGGRARAAFVAGRSRRCAAMRRSKPRRKAAAMPGLRARRAAAPRRRAARRARRSHRRDRWRARPARRSRTPRPRSCARRTRSCCRPKRPSASRASTCRSTAAPWAPARSAFMLRFPVGVVAGITPFNAPFNLACHKIAPAIAAGNTHGVEGAAAIAGRDRTSWRRCSSKPARRPACSTSSTATPSARRWCAIRAWISSLSPARRRAGAAIKAAAACAASRWNWAATAPPSCTRTPTSPRRHRSARATPCGSPARAASRCRASMCTGALYEAFVELVVAEVKKLKLGDPLDPATDVGTLIDESAAQRVEDWVNEAASGGAQVSDRRQAPWRADRADGAGRRQAGDEGGVRGGIRAGGQRAALRRHRRGFPHDQRWPVRVADRHLHEVDANSRSARSAACASAASSSTAARPGAPTSSPMAA